MWVYIVFRLRLSLLQNIKENSLNISIEFSHNVENKHEIDKIKDKKHKTTQKKLSIFKNIE